MTKRIRLSLPAYAENLTLVRQFVENFIEGTAFGNRSFEIQLVISEACTNVIRHAYDDPKASSLVTIYGSMTLFTLTLTVKDTGNGLVGSEREIEFPGDGGYGITLMRNLTDRFCLEASPGHGTTVNLTFHRSLIPAVLTQRRTLVTAMGIVLLTGGVEFGAAVRSAPPESSFYPARLVVESVVLKAPVGSVNRVDLALAMAEVHLDECEQAYRDGKFGSLDKAFEPVLKDIDLVDDQYRKLPIPDQYRTLRKLRSLQARLIKISGDDLLRADRDKQPTTLINFQVLLGRAVDITGHILEARASGGEQI